MEESMRRSLALLFLVFLSFPALPQNGPPPHVRTAIQSVERMIEGSGDDTLERFAAEHLTPEYRSTFTPEALLSHLRTMREAVGGNIGAVSVDRDPDGLRLQISGTKEATFRVVIETTGLISKLELMETPAEPPSPEAAIWASTTWESVAADVKRAEEAGFHGVVLLRHDGKEALRGTYGKATQDTVYCIGSTPIDFTVTGIMLLGQRGKLTLDDPITRFFPDAPADKRAMTVRQLLTGKSGLPNFHHVPTDWDADLAWVDRDTAVKRILAQPLLFAPGQGDAHSHSAFGLLAAVIETVSGDTYRDFVRTEILKPLGMTRTGFYGESLGLPLSEFAIGHGDSAVGVPNIPPNWGPTSWLVMGSGGMFSTLPDMDRYDAAIASGKLLTGEWAKWQQGEEVGVGGSDRGYFIFHATNGKGNEALFLMNGEGRAPAIRAMSGAFRRLVLGR
jgi:CubicO group peptidase (beta-lactamase class C family)